MTQQITASAAHAPPPKERIAPPSKRALNIPPRKIKLAADISPDERAYGRRLKGLRIEHGKTIDDVAAVVGIAKTTYAAYERGQWAFSYRRIPKIAAALGVTTAEFISRLFPEAVDDYPARQRR